MASRVLFHEPRTDKDPGLQVEYDAPYEPDMLEFIVGSRSSSTFRGQEDGACFIHRDQVQTLYFALGAWLKSLDTPAADG